MTGRHRRNTEPYVNGVAARALDRRHPLWKAGAEQTRTFVGGRGNIAISEQALAAGLSQPEQVVSQIAYRLRRYLRPARPAKIGAA